MSDKKNVHRGPSFRGLLSPRTRQTPANPSAEQMTAAPAFPVDRLPEYILGNIVGFLRRAQPERNFLCDVRNFSLVSRQAAAAVKSFADTDIGNILESATRGYARKRAFAEAALRAKKKKAISLTVKSGTKPPTRLIKVAKKKSGRIEINLGASPTDDTVYAALLTWGNQLPLTAIRISCGMSDHPILPSSEQLMAHIELTTDLLISVGYVPHEKLDQIEIHVVGPATITKEEERKLDSAVARLTSATAAAPIFCVVGGVGLSQRLQSDLDEARQENFQRMMRESALKLWQ